MRSGSGFVLIAVATMACGKVESSEDCTSGTTCAADAQPESPPDAGADAGVDAAPESPDAAAPLGPWQVQPRLNVSTNDHNETAPTMRADGLELYFHSDQKKPGEYDIYVATRSTVAANWGDAAIASVSIDGAYDIAPTLSRDGKTLWFGSTRPNGKGGFDVWVSTRMSLTSPWSPPINVETVNSSAHDVPSGVTTDGKLLGITSNRTDGRYDLFAATRDSTAVDAVWRVASIDELNTAADEQHPAFSDDRRRVYFVNSDNDLCVAERNVSTGRFDKGVRIMELTSSGNENHVKVSADERSVLFTSTRDGTEDLFEARR